MRPPSPSLENGQRVSPSQAALDTEMTDLEYQVKALLRQVAREREPVEQKAEAKALDLITKAYALGGRAEWSRAQAARIECDQPEAKARRCPKCGSLLAYSHNDGCEHDDA